MARKYEEEMGTDGPVGADERSRTLFFLGDVEPGTVGQAIMILETFDRKDGPVRIVLSSHGGEVTAGMALYDAIRMSHNPVIADVYGYASSMAVILLQAASLRRASPESRILVHPGTAGVQPVPTPSLIDLAQEMDRNHDRYCEILAERSGQKLSVITKLCSKESFMSAEEAKKLGLLDEVLETHNPMPVRTRKVRRRKR